MTSDTLTVLRTQFSLWRDQGRCVVIDAWLPMSGFGLKSSDLDEAVPPRKQFLPCPKARKETHLSKAGR